MNMECMVCTFPGTALNGNIKTNIQNPRFSVEKYETINCSQLLGCARRTPLSITYAYICVYMLLLRACVLIFPAKREALAPSTSIIIFIDTSNPNILYIRMM